MMERNRKLRLLVITDCPVPKGEDFKRLSILWKE